MKDKRWAKISAFVGILGGPLALFPYCRYFALTWRQRSHTNAVPLHY